MVDEMSSKKFLGLSVVYWLSGFVLIIASCVQNELVTTLGFYSGFAISVVFYLFSFYMQKKTEIKLLNIWINPVYCVLMFAIVLIFDFSSDAVNVMVMYLICSISLFFLGISNRLKKYYVCKNRTAKCPDSTPRIRLGAEVQKRKNELLKYGFEVTDFSKVFKGASIFCFVLLLVFPILNIL